MLSTEYWLGVTDCASHVASLKLVEPGSRGPWPPGMRMQARVTVALYPCPAQPPSLSVTPSQTFASRTMRTERYDDDTSNCTFSTPFGRVTRIPTRAFLDNHLPPLPAELHYPTFLGSLRRRRKLWKQLVTNQDRLWGYGKCPPSQIAPSRAYKNFQSCFSKLATSIPGRNR